MKTLVIGGTGTVGSQVVRELLARGATDITVLARNPDKVQLPDGVKALRGDLLDPDTARNAFKGFEAVFMLNATGPTENHEGLMGVWGAQLSGVKRFVYLSIHHVEQAPAIPHFASKWPIEAAVKASGMEWTIIRPNNFFQNEEWFKQAILDHGVYPQPIGPKGLSRVDVRDIAEASAIALTQPGHNGKVYELAGPDILTGEMTAEIWGRAIGRPVRYAGDDLDQWENTFRPWFAPWMLYDFKLMYRWFIDHGLVATKEEIDTLTKLLGHPPRSFEAYTQETAARWLAGKNSTTAS